MILPLLHIWVIITARKLEERPSWLYLKKHQILQIKIKLFNI